MCEIVDAYPPRAEIAAAVAAQIRDSGCELSVSPEIPAGGTIRGLACEIASEFSLPGTQHIVERVCKTVLRSD
jgi:hypothetical protein